MAERYRKLRLVSRSLHKIASNVFEDLGIMSTECTLDRLQSIAETPILSRVVTKYVYELGMKVSVRCGCFTTDTILLPQRPLGLLGLVSVDAVDNWHQVVG